MPQLQSLHLHLQAPVLTEPGLDSLLSVWPRALLPVLSGSRLHSHLGVEAIPPVPWTSCPFRLYPSLSIRLFGKNSVGFKAKGQQVSGSWH